jgi:hypothetical protein
MSTANASIRHAFHELTMTLLGLFEVYDAKPELVEHAAEEIESILRRHIPKVKTETEEKQARYF